MVLAYEQRGGFEPKIVDQSIYIIFLATTVVMRFYYALQRRG